MDSNYQKKEKKITDSKATIIAAIIVGASTIIAAMIGIQSCGDKKPNDIAPPIALDLTGWTPWHGITLEKGKKSNECIINSNGKIGDNGAGFKNEGLELLRGKTLILCFFDIEKSEFFDNNRFVKLEYENNVPVIPSNNAAPLIGSDKYLSAADAQLGKGIEFVIDPDKFKGRLNFVFSRADLKDLKITACYKNSK